MEPLIETPESFTARVSGRLDPGVTFRTYSTWRRDGFCLARDGQAIAQQTGQSSRGLGQHRPHDGEVDVLRLAMRIAPLPTLGFRGR